MHRKVILVFTVVAMTTVFAGSAGAQHGPETGHLPPSSQNVRLMGQAAIPGTDEFEGIVSDVGYLKSRRFGHFAYLGEHSGGRPSPECRGGVHVFDINNPRNPQLVNFLESPPDTYVTEGVHAMHVNTDSFTGDILLLSNESCGPNGPGGLTIWDITNPRKATRLAAGVGDNTFGDVDSEDTTPWAHDSHSVLGFKTGGRLFAAAIDNDELLDVDIFNITNPRRPRLIAETDITELVSEGADIEVNAFGDFPNAHDFAFDQIRVPGLGLTSVLSVSYWDAGWIHLNVNSPKNPEFIADSNYPDCDPEYPGVCPPEGNAHQSEFDPTGEIFIGTDEDQSAFRLLFEITEGPHAGAVDAGQFGWTVPIQDLPDGVLNGPTVYGGYGCPNERDDIPTPQEAGLNPGPGEETILVMQRGPVADPNNPFDACFFSEKVETAQLLGYDAAIVGNHHVGASEGLTPDSFICGSKGHEFDTQIPGVCVGHRTLHNLFDRPDNPQQTYPPDYSVPYPVGDPGDVEPDMGDRGWPVRAVAGQFDGWGYARLIDAQSMQELDTMSLPEQSSEAIAQDFTIDLSVHEVAIERRLRFGRTAYFAWYNAGFRVACYTNTTLREVGHYIPEGGHDLWGVEDAQIHNGRRIVVVSDRAYGLFVYKYIGPECP